MENAEQLDEHDWELITRLGYAVARAQLFEYALVKLLEAQRHDLAVPLDNRWDEILKWLRSRRGRRAVTSSPQGIRKDLNA